jgi:hypothetical protein
MSRRKNCLLLSLFDGLRTFNKYLLKSKMLLPCLLQRYKEAGHWWLTPVILATQEAEIRRIVVRSQFRANSLQDPISNKTITKKGW